MFNALFMLLPQETYLLIVVLSGFLIMIGLRQMGVGLLVSVLFLAFFGPFIDSLVGALPTWLLAVLFLFFILTLFRLIFGERVADHVIAHLLYDLIRAPFRFMAWLLRGFGPGRRV